MRVLQVSSARRWGGSETHVLELTQALRANGHDVVLAGRRDGPLQPQLHFPFLGAADLLTAHRLRRLLTAESFDIVHLHKASDYLPVTAACRRMPAPKLVCTRRLLHPIRYPGLYRRVDGWIAPTRQILHTLSPLRPSAAAVIPNWVDLAKFPYRPRSLRHPVRLGVLGEIAPHKGHDDAVEALRILGGAYRLSFAGIGRPQYVEALRKKSGGLPVDFVGFITPQEFFDMVDLLLLPSWEEPFGLVLLEAMASGVPVIAAGSGGPAEIVRSGVDGLLTPPRDPRALADAVRVLSNDELRMNLAAQARRRVESGFDIRQTIPMVERFYRDLLGMPHS